MTGPLAGVRIVMMGGLGPGPFCGMLLAGLGADLVRVDRVAEVDGPPADRHPLAARPTLGRDRHARPARRDIVHALIADADAFVDVYRPGVAERLGIGPDDLLAVSPRLVYARMTG